MAMIDIVNKTEKKLLLKFAELFRSGTLVSVSETVLCGGTILRCFPNHADNVSTYAELNKSFDKLLRDPNITDKDLINGLITLQPQELSLIAPAMLAEIFANEEFKKLSLKASKEFQKNVNLFLNFQDVSKCHAEDVVLNAQYLRSIIKNSSLKDEYKTFALGKIDEKVNLFTSEIDSLYLSRNAYNNNAWNLFKNSNVMAKMRLSDVKLYGEEKGNEIADARDASIHAAKNNEEKNALIAFHLNAHDKTRLAVLAACKKSPKDYPDIFLAQNVDGGTKKDPHYIPDILKTFGISTGVSFGLGLAIPLLANIPVVGNVLGPVLAGAAIVGTNLGREIGKARKIAQAENRQLTTQEKVNIGINLATSAAPYMAMLAIGPLGRGIGSVIMGLKAASTDLIRKKSELVVGQKLSGREILKSVCYGAGKALATALGGWLGSTAASYTLDFSQTGFAHLFAKKSQITADEQHLQTLRSHKFDLTANARRTANPDNDRMYQLDQASNRYTQQDWYDKSSYDQAIAVLKKAGVEDADGALRNLAGANRFKGGEFGTELDNLLQGKLSNNTIDQILKADQILDRTGALNTMQMQQTPHTSTQTLQAEAPTTKFTKFNLPARTQDYSFTKQPAAESLQDLDATVKDLPTEPSIPLPKEVERFSFQQNDQLPQHEVVDTVIPTTTEVETPSYQTTHEDSIPLPTREWMETGSDTGAYEHTHIMEDSIPLPSRDWVDLSAKAATYDNVGTLVESELQEFTNSVGEPGGLTSSAFNRMMDDIKVGLAESGDYSQENVLQVIRSVKPYYSVQDMGDYRC